MIYLASPYSHHTPAIKEQRFQAVLKAAAELMSQGEIVFSPIAHCHPIAVIYGVPGDWHYWEKYDRAFIEACDRFIVLKLDGWEASVGVNAECEFARQIGRIIEYVEQ